jgi:ribosomal protein S18 acetylase RimI-like enzyme
MNDVTVREAGPDDEAILWEMLVQAAHMAADGDASVEAARQHPFLAKFVCGWGRPGDLGVVAHDAGGQRPLGAAWLRHLTGEEQSYPAVDPAYPERGIGGQLLGRLIALARRSYPGIVLSVRSDNPARRLYERHGFVLTGEIVNRVGTCSRVMELRLLP